MRTRKILIAALVAIGAIIASAALWKRHLEEQQRHRAAMGGFYIDESRDRGETLGEKRDLPPAGALHGSIVDENDQPIYAMEVDLIGTEYFHGTEDERFRAMKKDWRDKNGQYRFSGLSPGEYFLSVGTEAAPTGEQPFAPSYYSGTAKQKFAEPIRVQVSKDIELRSLRLQRIPTETIKVHVRWRDGTPVAQSNLLFYNPSFSNQGVIGNVAPFVSGGETEMVIPTGFDYYARAVVHCAGGTRIQSIESLPVQKIRIDHKHVPQELTFVIPSEQCQLWSPPKESKPVP